MCVGGCVDLLNLVIFVVNRRQINKIYNFTSVFKFAQFSCESRNEKPPKLTPLAVFFCKVTNENICGDM